MKKNILFVSLAAMTLLLSACGGNNSSAAPASSGSTPTPSSQPSGGEAGVLAQWDAQENIEDSQNFSSAGKLKAVGDYVEYKFTASKAGAGMLWAEVENRTDSPYNRETQSGNQSVWWDYYNGRENGGAWKYTVTFNDAEIDQDAQAPVKIEGEDVALKEVMYTDFLSDDADNPVVPWFACTVKAGENTIRIERSNGYSVSFVSFKILG